MDRRWIGWIGWIGWIADGFWISDMSEKHSGLTLSWENFQLVDPRLCMEISHAFLFVWFAPRVSSLTPV